MIAGLTTSSTMPHLASYNFLIDVIVSASSVSSQSPGSLSFELRSLVSSSLSPVLSSPPQLNAEAPIDASAMAARTLDRLLTLHAPSSTQLAWIPGRVIQGLSSSARLLMALLQGAASKTGSSSIGLSIWLHAATTTTWYGCFEPGTLPLLTLPPYLQRHRGLAVLRYCGHVMQDSLLTPDGEFSG